MLFEVLLSLLAMFSLMRLLLELKLGRERKLWTYLLGEDGSKTLPLNLLAVIMTILVILTIAGLLPDAINLIVFYGVVPLALVLLFKHHEVVSMKKP